MMIRDYQGKGVTDLVLYAGEFLERRGEIFGHGFGIGDAISKATEMFLVYLEEELDWDEIKRSLKLKDGLGDWT